MKTILNASAQDTPRRSEPQWTRRWAARLPSPLFSPFPPSPLVCMRKNRKGYSTVGEIVSRASRGRVFAWRGEYAGLCALVL